MYKLLFSLAWKYIHNAQSKYLRTTLIMSFISIAVSCAILLLGISIMNGFEHATYTHLRNAHGDLTIKAPPGTTLSFAHMKPILDKEFPDICYKPRSTHYALMTHGASSSFVFLTAVDPSCEYGILATPHTILLGDQLAKELQISKGHSVQLHYIDPHSEPLEHIKLKADVGGIITTGLEEYDAHTVYCSFEYLEHYLENSGVTEIQVYVSPNKPIEQVQGQLRNRFALPVYSWSELYPSLADTLALEKYVVTCILALIVILAVCTLISVVTIFLTQKQRDIALLKTMGLTTPLIQLFCYIFGLSIPISASIIGLLGGSTLGILVDHYHLFPLPNSYIVPYLPIDIHFWHIILIFFFIVLLSSSIIWIACRTLNTLSPAQVLKVE